MYLSNGKIEKEPKRQMELVKVGLAAPDRGKKLITKGILLIYMAKPTKTKVGHEKQKLITKTQS